jgi:diketogulonate reductase-like aldo/keto reductase
MNDTDPKLGTELTRRGFLKGAAIAGISAVIPAEKIPAAVETRNKSTLANFQARKRPLGRTGLECSILGMGGFHLGTVADQAEVNNMVAKAIDHGIDIFDNAWDFHKGLSEEKLGVALKGKRDTVIVMSAVCTHCPGQDVAIRMLDASLTRLQTDHLDVWQIHEVIYHNDPN